MIALEYDVTVWYDMAADVSAGFDGSRPFLSHAVQIVGVLFKVRADDPLRPLIRAVMPAILTWSYIPLYDSNMFESLSWAQILMPIAFDVAPSARGTWNVFCMFITTEAVSL